MRVHERKNVKGFTIPELLIIIVVIGIVTSIVIVAFTGIGDQSKNARGNANAKMLVTKLEAWKSFAGYYPTHTDLFDDPPHPSADIGALKNNVYDYAAYTSHSRDINFYKDNDRLVIGRTSSGGNIVGMCIYYWDYVKNERIGKKVGQLGYCHPSP